MIRTILRSLLRQPGFTAAAVLTLGLGLAACATILALLQGVLLRPLPYPESGRLVVFTMQGDREADIGAPDAVDLRRELTTVASVAAFTPGWAFDLVGDGAPERLNGSTIDPEFFEVLGTAPLLGRTFSRADGGAALAVLSEDLWRGRFAADPGIVGRSIVLSGRPYNVVGVMPGSFSAIDPTVRLWVPIAAETPWAVAERGSNHLEAIGRLAPGASIEAARREVLSVSTGLSRLYPRTNGGKLLVADPLADYLGAPARPALLALAAAVLVLLLLVCANLSSLLLARSTARSVQNAVRVALGATPRHLLGAALAETTAIGILGGVIGLVLATWATAGVVSLAGDALPRAAEVTVDLRVVGGTFALAMLAAVVTALLPAWRVSRQPPASALGGVREGLTHERHRVLQGTVVVQAALATALLLAAVLLGRTFARLQRVNLGFRAEGVLTADIVLPESRYADPAAQTRAFRSIVTEVERIPGVAAAATVIGTPIRPSGLIGHTVLIEGADNSNPGGARNRPVHGDYLALMGIPVLRGRGFSERDDERAVPVAIVNETFANANWPGADPTGRRIAWRLGDEPPVWMTVVGVAGDVRANRAQDGDVPAVYTRYVQRSVTWQRFGTLMVRTAGAPGELAQRVREAVWRVDPALPLDNTVSMSEAVRNALWRERLSAVIAGTLAGAALLLAAQGLYSVLAFVVGQRRRELAVRLALGATPAAVRQEVLGAALRLSGTGTALGLLAGLVLVQALRALLYGVSPYDGISFAVAGLGLLSAAFMAAWIPAWRASRMDPVSALKGD